MIAIWVVAVWLVVGLMVGVLFGTAIRKARGDEDSAVTVPPAAEIRYLRKNRHRDPDARGATANPRKQLAKHHAAA